MVFTDYPPNIWIKTAAMEMVITISTTAKQVRIFSKLWNSFHKYDTEKLISIGDGKFGVIK